MMEINIPSVVYYRILQISKNKEDILAWNETLLRIMTDSTRYGYYVADKRTDTVLYVNENFCELWNISGIMKKSCIGR